MPNVPVLSCRSWAPAGQTFPVWIALLYAKFGAFQRDSAAPSSGDFATRRLFGEYNPVTENQYEWRPSWVMWICRAKTLSGKVVCGARCVLLLQETPAQLIVFRRPYCRNNLFKSHRTLLLPGYNVSLKDPTIIITRWTFVFLDKHKNHDVKHPQNR